VRNVGKRTLTRSGGSERNGEPLRDPLERRKAMLASVLAKSVSSLRLNEHLEHDDS